MQKVFVINGPNLNLLGIREPNIYGSISLQDIEQKLEQKAQKRGVQLVCRQSNHEGMLVDWIQEAGQQKAGIILNAAAYTHTSIALRDAITGSKAQVIELHLSNIHARESFRHHSTIAPVCIGSICGFGALGYDLAFDAIMSVLNNF